MFSAFSIASITGNVFSSLKYVPDFPLLAKITCILLLCDSKFFPETFWKWLKALYTNFYNICYSTLFDFEFLSHIFAPSGDKSITISTLILFSAQTAILCTTWHVLCYQLFSESFWFDNTVIAKKKFKTLTIIQVSKDIQTFVQTPGNCQENDIFSLRHFIRKRFSDWKHLHPTKVTKIGIICSFMSVWV